MPSDARSDARTFEELTCAALDRSDAVYASIHFAPSNPHADRTFGLFEENALLGLGRIQHHMDGELEVGGFWVDESRRATGLARAMVEHVLEQLPSPGTAWCIPFEHLRDFYCSFGMQDAEPDAAPASIRAKLAYCEQLCIEGHYQPLRLLRHTSG